MIITLCGSGRFWDDFDEYDARLSRGGNVVFNLGDRLKNYTDNNPDAKDPQSLDDKETLDLVHLLKISKSECVVVVRGDEYIGESTRRELKWASMCNKPIFMSLDKWIAGEALHYGQIFQRPRNATEN